MLHAACFFWEGEGRGGGPMVTLFVRLPLFVFLLPGYICRRGRELCDGPWVMRAYTAAWDAGYMVLGNAELGLRHGLGK